MRIMLPELKTYQDQKPLKPIYIDKLIDKMSNGKGRIDINDKETKKKLRKAMKEEHKKQKRKERRAKIRGFSSEDEIDYEMQVLPNAKAKDVNANDEKYKLNEDVHNGEIWICHSCETKNSFPDSITCISCKAPGPFIKCPACTVLNWDSYTNCTVCNNELNAVYFEI